MNTCAGIPDKSLVVDSNAVGSIDEKGYLKGFKRRGFTLPKCILELVANILDAYAPLDAKGKTIGLKKKIIFDIQKRYIKLIDNASGMTMQDIINMFALHRENHASDTSRGVSGVGAKPSLSILSNETEVHIFTLSIDEDKGYHITVPWHTIHEKGKYTGMLKVSEMTEAELINFIVEREENEMLNIDSRPHGTTIVFKRNDKLKDVIHQNFLPIELTELKPLDRISVVFGRENVEVIYNDYENSKLIMDMYNYFGAEQSEYYKGYAINTIEQWYNPITDEDRFIWRKGEKQFEIVKVGKGLSKDAVEKNDNTTGFIMVGHYTVKAGLRIDYRNIFDPENPKEITASARDPIYNTNHIGKNEIFLSSNRLVRNGQIIGLLPCEEKVGNARADGKQYFNILLMQCEVCYNPVSKQNTEENHQDRVTNTQENKNQHDGESVPKTLTRLVRSIKKEKADEIWNYFQEVIEKKKPKKPIVKPTPLPAQPIVQQLATPESIAEQPAYNEVVIEESSEEDIPTPRITPEILPSGPPPSSPKPTLPPSPPSLEPVTLSPTQVEIPPFIPPAPIPQDVSAHRKGCVFGSELRDEMQRVINIIVNEESYTDNYVKLFNLLKMME